MTATEESDDINKRYKIFCRENGVTPASHKANLTKPASEQPHYFEALWNGDFDKYKPTEIKPISQNGRVLEGEEMRQALKGLGRKFNQKGMIYK